MNIYGCCPGTGVMAIFAQSWIMIVWHTMAICTSCHACMIDANDQPGIGNVATGTGSRIMIHRCLMAVAAITHRMVEYATCPR